MTPSVTLSVSAETPSFLAARPMSRARTSAPAMRSAVPLCSIDWLPAVCPSLGVRPVSPEIIVTRPSGTSSSSAAIWASAVTMPCPSSTLPVNTVALPSASMRIQASSMRFVCRLPGSVGCWANATFGSSEKTTTRAPSPAVKSRRETIGAFMSAPPRGLGGAQHRTHDPVMGAAAAQVERQPFAHLRFGGMRRAVEDGFGAHDHAVDAVAALRRLLGDEGLLQRMRPVHAAEAFDRHDLGLADIPDRYDAGAYRLPGDQDPAGPARRQPAAEYRAVERKIIAQHVEQRRVRLGRNVAHRAVHLQADGHGRESPIGFRVILCRC